MQNFLEHAHEFMNSLEFNLINDVYNKVLQVLLYHEKSVLKNFLHFRYLQFKEIDEELKLKAMFQSLLLHIKAKKVKIIKVMRILYKILLLFK